MISLSQTRLTYLVLFKNGSRVKTMAFAPKTPSSDFFTLQEGKDAVF